MLKFKLCLNCYERIEQYEKCIYAPNEEKYRDQLQQPLNYVVAIVLQFKVLWM